MSQHSQSGKRIIYFDPFAGAAGDMMNAALIDLGADIERINNIVANIGSYGLAVSVHPVMKGAIGALHFDVHANEEQQPEFSTPPALHALIETAAISPWVSVKAHSIIDRLARAEAHVHRVDPATIHFHELGGLDTIVDVLGALIGLESLGVQQCYTGPLPMNTGTWGMMHGSMPLPVPATLQIIAEASLAICPPPDGIPINQELVTPTGAALLAELAVPIMPTMQIEKVGYGAGTRDLAVPNILRAWLGTLTNSQIFVQSQEPDEHNPTVSYSS